MARTFVVFDLETCIDKPLIRQTQYPHLDLTDEDAYHRFRTQILEETQKRSDFIPIPYHVPISIAIGVVDANYTLLAVTSLQTGCGDHQPPAYHLSRQFWSLVNQGAHLVTFNGRSFDLPVLELTALKYELPAPKYWTEKFGARYRYSDDGHMDLCDILCNAGAIHLRGGLNTVMQLLGYRGKSGLDGSQVQQAWEAGRLQEIHDYCQLDVIATWALFVRLELIRGRLSPAQYRKAMAASEPFVQRILPASSSQPLLF